MPSGKFDKVFVIQLKLNFGLAWTFLSKLARCIGYVSAQGPPKYENFANSTASTFLGETIKINFVPKVMDSFLGEDVSKSELILLLCNYLFLIRKFCLTT